MVLGQQRTGCGRALKAQEPDDTHLGDEPAKLMIVEPHEEGHRVEVSFPQEFHGALGKEGSINSVESCHVLQEKARHRSSQSGLCPKKMASGAHPAARLGG